MRRNCALTPKQLLKFYIVLVCLSVTVATGFLLAGVWVIPIFTSLELAAVSIGFLIYCRKALDCETIQIDGKRLIVKNLSAIEKPLMSLIFNGQKLSPLSRGQRYF